MNKYLENKQILIIGLGLIGGSYAKGLFNKGYNIKAIDSNKESIEYGLKNGFINEGYDYVNEDLISKSDIIIFALYPNILLEYLNKYQHLFKKDAIITDVTGVKVSIIEKIDLILRDDVTFVGAHPMAGREVYGIKNSNYEIFKGANYIITPTSKVNGYAIEVVNAIGEELEFKNISIISPEEHDEMIAFLSQLTHCIAVSLMCSKSSKHLVKYTGDSFRDLTRIARINENMWSELFLMNKSQLIEQMNLFSEKFNELKDAIETENVDKIKEMMITSTRRRSYFDK